ncbi:MAG: three-Cys-motif partner protein TcmP, partial [Myxococcota bacterium]
MADYKDASPKYWDEYNNFQHQKHGLIRKYLQGWFPKLGLKKEVTGLIYVDTHAGRGRHSGGQEGSPLVALNTILNHDHITQILARKRLQNVSMVFIERDAENYEALRQELSQITRPPKLNVWPRKGDSFGLLDGISDRLARQVP